MATVPSILVVEADPLVRNLMIRVLSHRGFTVYEAADAAEALSLCKSCAGKIDLLIADHATTGRDMTEQMLVACPDTKVLHISGWPFETIQEQNAFIPGSSFLKKPFTAVELANSVQALLSPRTQ
ncbi:MAG: histidine kinase [Bryobacterales bacterium]|nr:histidine kinase [Bryobacterales bacterium]